MVREATFTRTAVCTVLRRFAVIKPALGGQPEISIHNRAPHKPYCWFNCHFRSRFPASHFRHFESPFSWRIQEEHRLDTVLLATPQFRGLIIVSHSLPLVT